MDRDDFTNKIKTSMYWWLNRRRAFVINGEYKIELLFIDKENYSAKILITNLKDGNVQEIDPTAMTSDNSYHQGDLYEDDGLDDERPPMLPAKFTRG